MDKENGAPATASSPANGLHRRMHLHVAAFVLMACGTAGPWHAHARETIAEESAPRATSQTAAQPATTNSQVQFPPELVGFWIGTQYSCPGPGDEFDAEAIMGISLGEMVGYEEAYKPTKVTLISESPRTWEVEALLDIGPSGMFSEFGPITFTLNDGVLTADHKQQDTNFKKCPPAVSEVTYPVAMHGIWMPENFGCSSPLNYDSEVLLSVGANTLGQYENTTKPLRVDVISQQPPTWQVLSTFSPGTGEYEGSEIIVYSVAGDTMAIDNGETKSVFSRCE